MEDPDKIIQANKEHWEKAVADGAGCTRPHLTLDTAAFQSYREGRTTRLPVPHCDNAVDAVVMKDVDGKDVLCLAAGGGQQSVAYSLLGARVTVFDLAEGQLEGDRTAAEHYGYEIVTVQGNMQDLSVLSDDSFDIVHGMGMAWVPHTAELYSEVSRVLRRGGLYRVEFTNPAVEFMDWSSWDETGYRISVPYEQRSDKDGTATQFRHYMSEIFNGLLANGLAIEQVEDRWIDKPDLSDPGSWSHWMAFIVGFEVVARKQ